MKIIRCRDCNDNNVVDFFSLGKLYLARKFLKNTRKLRSDYLNLLICEDCKLLQLDGTPSLNKINIFLL